MTWATAEINADISKRQYAFLLLGLIAGTFVEWYDYTVYAQLSSTLSGVFFPPSSSAETKQLAFWATYAAGFIARPLGALVFGLLGDYSGRRRSLLTSIVGVTLPTILIGCLPTYAQAGIAAPAILSILRILQGIAVGGEWGSVVYMYETAPEGWKGLLASFAQWAIAPGMLVAMMVVQLILYTTTPEQLQLWAWRVPFLLAILTTPISILFRLRMPESREYLQSIALRQHSIKLAKAASQKRSSSCGSKQQASQCNQAGALQCGGSGLCCADHTKHLAAAMAFPVGQQPCKDFEAPGKAAAKQLEPEPAAAAALAAHNGRLPLLLLLIRHHWLGMLLQFLLESNMEAAFYTMFGYLPSYLAATKVISLKTSLWILVLGLVSLMASTPVGGHLADKVKKVWLYMAVTVCVTVTAVVLLTVGLKSVAAVWVLQPLVMGMAGFLAGLICSIGPQIFPVSCIRFTGFSLAHNLSATLFGGLMPFCIAALSLHWPAPMAASVILAVLAVVTLLAAVGLLLVAPATNELPPARAIAAVPQLVSAC